MNRQTAAGGAATAGGMIYQVLWTLLRSLEIHVNTSDRDWTTSDITTIFTIEPLGGGGDLVVAGSEVCIEQMKSRANHSTWSLQAIIADVLPDMFLAAYRQKSGQYRYRLITEGRRGDWAEVNAFFESLARRKPAPDILSTLDDIRPLRFRHNRSEIDDQSAFFPKPEYTERTLFVRIYEELIRRPVITKLNLTLEQYYQTLYQLLSGFEFVGNQSLDFVEAEIDRLLLAVVDHREKIPQVRQALAMRLLEMAASGNTHFSSTTLMQECGLASVPLTEWAALRIAAAQKLTDIQRSQRFDETLDVRAEMARSIFEEWKEGLGTLIITGDSGCGKTWTLHAIASIAAADDAPVVWVDASGDADKDIQAAADTFWLDIRKGNDASLRLAQVAERLKDVLPYVSPTRLRVFIDNVTNADQATKILAANWPNRGIQIAISCPLSVAESLKEQYQSRILQTVCNDLTWEQLHEYLRRRTGKDWSRVPADVRDTLRRPLLARIYADELYDDEWSPILEYELYNRMWCRLSESHLRSAIYDAIHIESLAITILDGAPYPWSPQQCLKAGLDTSVLDRVEKAGWLEYTKGYFRVVHDRLLNWAVARSIYSRFRQGLLTEDQVILRIKEIDSRECRYANVTLGYVSFDLLWMLTETKNESQAAANRLLMTIEELYQRQAKELYCGPIRTLGSRILPSLFDRIKTFDGLPFVLTAIIDAAVAIGGPAISDFARSLLEHDSPVLKRRGVKLLGKYSCPELLDLIWMIHVEANSNPRPWLEEHENEGHFGRETFDALSKAAPNQTQWIIGRIEQADPSIDPVHDLAWLVEQLNDDGNTWNRCKSNLFSKIPPKKARVLAVNSGKYRDHESLSWLQTQITNHHDLCAPLALQALSRINKDAALEGFARISESDLFWGSEALTELFHRHPVEVLNSLRRKIESSERPWLVMQSFWRHINYLTRDILEFLVSDLTRQLSNLSGGCDNGNVLYRQLQILAEIHMPGLLDVIREQRGTAFEDELSSFLLEIGPRKGRDPDSHARVPGLALLRTIGGSGFHRVINMYLQCNNQMGRYEAIDWAMRSPNSETLRLLALRVSDPIESGDENPFEQMDAIEGLCINSQWSDAVEGVRRWGLQCSSDLTMDRIAPAAVPCNKIQHLRESVKVSPSVGDILALGFCGTEADIQTVQSILSKIDISSETSLACIIALDLLGDTSEAGSQLVSRNLGVREHQFRARQMLTFANTATADESLFYDLQREFNYITALNLVNNSPLHDKAMALAQEYFPRNCHWGKMSELFEFILNIRDPVKLSQFLANSWLRERLHRDVTSEESNFWVTGSKVSKIRCLARIDAPVAFEAACLGLQMESWHDRERYPSLILEIDAERGGRFLLQRLPVEKNLLIRYAIGRSLAGSEVSEQLHGMLRSNCFRQREAACEVAGFQTNESIELSILQLMLNDPHDAVISAAMNAIHQKFTQSECHKLANRAKNVEAVADRWLYLDHLTELVDPGLPFEPCPELLLSAFENVSPLIVKRVLRRLRKRRDKLMQDMKNKDIHNST